MPVTAQHAQPARVPLPSDSSSLAARLDWFVAQAVAPAPRQSSASTRGQQRFGNHVGDGSLERGGITCSLRDPRRDAPAQRARCPSDTRFRPCSARWHRDRLRRMSDGEQETGALRPPQYAAAVSGSAAAPAGLRSAEKGFPLAQADRERARLTRKELLRSAAAAATGVVLFRYTGVAGAAARESAAKMNVLLFITDQDRAIQHFPRGWVSRNLPGYSRLIRNGLSFRRAFTNACMCSPARSTLFSGYFPAQHGVKYTLEEDMPPEGKPPDQYPQVELPVGLKNAASVMSAAGYNVVYKGKWHCSKPVGSQFTPADLERYGFQRWDPPDGGANQEVDQAGGGTTNNDGRYMNALGDAAKGGEGVLQYLNSVAATQQPFFLVVSLVNPHDVLFYPTDKFSEDGYDDSWLEGDIRLPATVHEDLRTKPRVQREF